MEDLTVSNIPLHFLWLWYLWASFVTFRFLPCSCSWHCIQTSFSQTLFSLLWVGYFLSINYALYITSHVSSQLSTFNWITWLSPQSVKLALSSVTFPITPLLTYWRSKSSLWKYHWLGTITFHDVRLELPRHKSPGQSTFCHPQYIRRGGNFGAHPDTCGLVRSFFQRTRSDAYQ